MNDVPETIAQINLGNEVVSKQTGFPGVGRVFGVYLARGYEFITQVVNRPQKFTRWNTLYPNWRDGLVFAVFYEEARKPLTWEEWQSGYAALPEERKTLSEFEQKEEYNKIPLTQTTAYPHEDLELFE